MDLDVDRDDFPGRRTVLQYVPVTVLAVAGICWVLAANDVRYDEVFGSFGHSLYNPFAYVANGLFHFDWSHFTGNMRLWLPFGVVLTWLTSNRHVLGLAFGTQVAASAVGLPIGAWAIGLSVVALGVASATLIRATGIAVQNQPEETQQAALAVAFVPILGGFTFVALLAGDNSWISHLGHLLGVLFGGAIEAIYVLEADEGVDRDGRRETVSRFR